MSYGTDINSAKSATFDSINLLDVGNTIQLSGAVWVGNGKVYIVPLPDEDLTDEWITLKLSKEEWERFLNQSDVLDVKGPGKAILRKSQRQIDQWIAWSVFRRDGFLCRYCGNEAPLTVDHIILWECGGATVVENLISACRRCNKLRGNLEYEAWINSVEYGRISVPLSYDTLRQNVEVIKQLDDLKEIVAKPRSR